MVRSSAVYTRWCEATHLAGMPIVLELTADTTGTRCAASASAPGEASPMPCSSFAASTSRSLMARVSRQLLLDTRCVPSSFGASSLQAPCVRAVQRLHEQKRCRAAKQELSAVMLLADAHGLCNRLRRRPDVAPGAVVRQDLGDRPRTSAARPAPWRRPAAPPKRAPGLERAAGTRSGATRPRGRRRLMPRCLHSTLRPCRVVCRWRRPRHQVRSTSCV